MNTKKSEGETFQEKQVLFKAIEQGNALAEWEEKAEKRYHQNKDKKLRLVSSKE